MGERNPVPSVHHRPPQARPSDRKSSKSLFLSIESTVRSSIGGDVPHGQLPSARADVGVRFEHCGWLLLYGDQMLTLLSCFLHQKILPGAENFILPEEILLVKSTKKTHFGSDGPPPPSLFIFRFLSFLIFFSAPSLQPECRPPHLPEHRFRQVHHRLHSQAPPPLSHHHRHHHHHREQVVADRINKRRWFSSTRFPPNTNTSTA